MYTLAAFLSVNCPWNEALEWLSDSLAREGLHILQTFDLQAARLGRQDCACPQHGAQNCNCQMVVLLVYGKASQPATLVLHGSGQKTWFSLVNNPLQRIDASTQSIIEHVLQKAPPE